MIDDIIYLDFDSELADFNDVLNFFSDAFYKFHTPWYNYIIKCVDYDSDFRTLYTRNMLSTTPRKLDLGRYPIDIILERFPTKEHHMSGQRMCFFQYNCFVSMDKEVEKCLMNKYMGKLKTVNVNKFQNFLDQIHSNSPVTISKFQNVFIKLRQTFTAIFS